MLNKITIADDNSLFYNNGLLDVDISKKAIEYVEHIRYINEQENGLERPRNIFAEKSNLDKVNFEAKYGLIGLNIKARKAVYLNPPTEYTTYNLNKKPIKIITPSLLIYVSLTTDFKLITDSWLMAWAEFETPMVLQLYPTPLQNMFGSSSVSYMATNDNISTTSLLSLYSDIGYQRDYQNAMNKACFGSANVTANLGIEQIPNVIRTLFSSYSNRDLQTSLRIKKNDKTIGDQLTISDLSSVHKYQKPFLAWLHENLNDPSIQESTLTDFETNFEYYFRKIFPSRINTRDDSETNDHLLSILAKVLESIPEENTALRFQKANEFWQLLRLMIAPGIIKLEL